MYYLPSFRADINSHQHVYDSYYVPFAHENSSVELTWTKNIDPCGISAFTMDQELNLVEYQHILLTILQGRQNTHQHVYDSYYVSFAHENSPVE